MDNMSVYVRKGAGKVLKGCIRSYEGLNYWFFLERRISLSDALWYYGGLTLFITWVTLLAIRFW